MFSWFALGSARRSLAFILAVILPLGVIVHAKSALGQLYGSGDGLLITPVRDSSAATGIYAPAVSPARPAEAIRRADPAPPSSDAAYGAGDIAYVIRPGDSLGSIAATFHVPLADLLRRNRLSVDATLQVGQTLEIPNPFLGQISRLKQEIGSLNRRNVALADRADQDRAKARETAAQMTELTAERQLLQHQAQLLPWWRRLTILAVGTMILMLGVTALALYEWFRMRRWFSVLVRANERLRHLDERYRAMVAKAELRFQQLYGRRRAMTEGVSKPPEEYEIERLNRELRQIIETQLSELGVSPRPTTRRWRLRDWLAGASEPASFPPERR